MTSLVVWMLERSKSPDRFKKNKSTQFCQIYKFQIFYSYLCSKKYVSPKWFEKHLKVYANNLGNDKEIFSGDLLKQKDEINDIVSL
ncbi:hypothetical protein BpHYR1_045148, partial [Brachionus plicatilis]